MQPLLSNLSRFLLYLLKVKIELEGRRRAHALESVFLDYPYEKHVWTLEKSGVQKMQKVHAGTASSLINEGDIVRALELPTLDGLDDQGVEDLCCALTCRHLATPLVLELIVSQRNYVSALLKSELRGVIETVLFEPLHHATTDALAADQIPPPSLQLSSPLGVLFSELNASPEAIYLPLLRLGEEVMRLNCAVGRRASFLVLLLFFSRVAARVVRFATRAAAEERRIAGAAASTAGADVDADADADAAIFRATTAPAARTKTLLVELKLCLVERVAPLLEEWLAFSRRSVFAEGDKGEQQRAKMTQRTVRLHAHLALCYASSIESGVVDVDAADDAAALRANFDMCVPRFLRSAAHVVQWHSNVAAVAQRLQSGHDAAMGESGSAEHRSLWPEATMELPLAEVFYAQQQSRHQVFAWCARHGEEDAGAAVNDALTSIALHSALRGGQGGDADDVDPLCLTWTTASVAVAAAHDDDSVGDSGGAAASKDGDETAPPFLPKYGSAFGYSAHGDDATTTAAAAAPGIPSPAPSMPSMPSMPMMPGGAAMLSKVTTSIGGLGRFTTKVGSGSSQILPKLIEFGPDVKMAGNHLRNAYGEILLSFHRGQPRVASVSIKRWRQVLRPDGSRNPTVIHGASLVSVNGSNVVSDDSDPQVNTYNGFLPKFCASVHSQFYSGYLLHMFNIISILFLAAPNDEPVDSD